MVWDPPPASWVGSWHGACRPPACLRLGGEVVSRGQRRDLGDPGRGPRQLTVCLAPAVCRGGQLGAGCLEQECCLESSFLGLAGPLSCPQEASEAWLAERIAGVPAKSRARQSCKAKLPVHWGSRGRRDLTSFDLAQDSSLPERRGHSLRPLSTSLARRRLGQSLDGHKVWPTGNGDSRWAG